MTSLGKSSTQQCVPPLDLKRKKMPNNMTVTSLGKSRNERNEKTAWRTGPRLHVANVTFIIVACMVSLVVKAENDIKDYGLVKRVPTRDEMDRNAVRFIYGEGFKCTVKGVGNTTSSSRTMTMFVEDSSAGDDCTPARWLDWELNCNKNGLSEVESVCDGEGNIRDDLSDMTFQGNEDCFLVGTALSITDDEQARIDLEEECKEYGGKARDTSGGSRRLDFFASWWTRLFL